MHLTSGTLHSCQSDWGGDGSKTGRVRPFEDSPSVEAVMAEIIRINFFQTLEVNQRLAAAWGMFIQEKRLNLSRNSKSPWSFNLPCAISHLPAQCHPWKPTAHVPGPKRNRTEPRASKVSFSQDWHPWACPVVPQKSPLGKKIAFIWCNSEFTQC